MHRVVDFWKTYVDLLVGEINFVRVMDAICASWPRFALESAHDGVPAIQRNMTWSREVWLRIRSSSQGWQRCLFARWPRAVPAVRDAEMLRWARRRAVHSPAALALPTLQIRWNS